VQRRPSKCRQRARLESPPWMFDCSDKLDRSLWKHGLEGMEKIKHGKDEYPCKKKTRQITKYPTHPRPSRLYTLLLHRDLTWTVWRVCASRVVLRRLACEGRQGVTYRQRGTKMSLLLSEGAHLALTVHRSARRELAALLHGHGCVVGVDGWTNAKSGSSATGSLGVGMWAACWSFGATRRRRRCTTGKCADVIPVDDVGRREGSFGWAGEGRLAYKIATRPYCNVRMGPRFLSTRIRIRRWVTAVRPGGVWMSGAWCVQWWDCWARWASRNGGL
jgi:hypothetical protein